MIKTLTIFGTRPEAIKMGPVVMALRATPGIVSRTCVTAQHREMLDQVLHVFSIVPDHDLNLMRPDQDLPSLTAHMLERLPAVFKEETPDVVLVQGDTTTAFAASLAAFYFKIPVAHVEAGLRTHNPQSPWPEEINRQMISRLAEFHFAPTERAHGNLLAEGVSADKVFLTGNTVIDALWEAAKQVDSNPALKQPLERRFSNLVPDRRLILVTTHRRENFGSKLTGILSGIKRLAERSDVQIVLPVHPNPTVAQTVHATLGHQPHVHLIAPTDYLGFVYLMKAAHIIITDSGGVQEEAPSLGKPVLVVRENTERPEAIEAGTAKLVGWDPDNLVHEASQLLDDPTIYQNMAGAKNPFGDGQASQRIARLLAEAKSLKKD